MSLSVSLTHTHCILHSKTYGKSLYACVTWSADRGRTRDARTAVSTAVRAAVRGAAGAARWPVRGPRAARAAAAPE